MIKKCPICFISLSWEEISGPQMNTDDTNKKLRMESILNPFYLCSPVAREREPRQANKAYRTRALLQAVIWSLFRNDHVVNV